MLSRICPTPLLKYITNHSTYSPGEWETCRPTFIHSFSMLNTYTLGDITALVWHGMFGKETLPGKWRHLYKTNGKAAVNAARTTY